MFVKMSLSLFRVLIFDKTPHQQQGKEDAAQKEAYLFACQQRKM